ncbi:M64 family metallopeptidase [Alkalimonas amylolytica]|uniref:Peptidase M64 N-terminus n=1 Tax=Alkalimonas amylolytica TaxID=152573 RepID=A0A1H3XKY1_ALKAM|nr:M64 family metallopeptidase [Alkalimonas amylolytica]SDZ99264.1 Peptidase M64 N-terminus [Alkalimonas amylolytica]
MKFWFLVGLLCLAGQLDAAAPATWRLDVLHGLEGGKEQFRKSGLWQEPLLWQGPVDLQDKLNRGDYRFEITKSATGELLYAQSYSSLFADWSLSSDTSHNERYFEESLRFPAPEVPARLQIFRRQLDKPGQPFQAVWQLDLPSQAQPAPMPPATDSIRLLQAANTEEQAYGLVFLAEGFQAGEVEAFFQAASELSQALFQYAPFDRLRPRMQVHAVMTPSTDSGIGFRNGGQPLDTRFAVNPNALGMPRYALSMEVHAIRNAAMAVPYHSIVILTNSSDYHGSGIFQTYAIAPAFHPRREFLLLHELGHSLAGLADEYFHDTPGYAGSDGTIEPYQPNITSKAGLAPLKWQHLATEGIPIPTPWNQQAFMQNRQMSTLTAEPHQGVVGAFLGANYSAEHYYRPALACIMLLDMGDNHFCPVCQQAIVEQIESQLSAAP